MVRMRELRDSSLGFVDQYQQIHVLLELSFDHAAVRPHTLSMSQISLSDT